MNNIQETKLALQVAKQHFQGIVRAIGPDTGLPYFDTHILRVVNSVPQRSKPAAALHDCLEDPNVKGHKMTLEELDSYGFEAETIAAVNLLTKGKESYSEYIETLTVPGEGEDDYTIANKIALEVKLADLMDNLRTCPEGSLRNRYINATHKVSGALRDF